ncbi:MAG: DUF4287 domain-containing protein [Alphaproteobacteria bacterium]|nr:DUF4287 domain-containing protein [Alphaproteobacteria bacterium]MBU1525293.1 DUF4287 domain-containing protein [Alphaproteobacteria bacterium]MBU2118527.1 DUF4287 domain-containing protein [Alphaproteobacteria bacterium]MBU2352594.1 DUF4287 domain-containing protein [Alphaproteobacteria bacterium]MBU2382294.1 DUF4287 domain-containing protein [Alphaproteobacteria bacterium]
MTGAVLTERQRKWFATVLANLETNTGRSLEQWRAVMETCPETAPRAQAAWLKTRFGVGANHAAQILDACQPSDAPGWDEPGALRAALWTDAASRTILEAVERIAGTHADVISGQRKGYTSFSRSVQFAAMRPLKGGKALLGLKLDPAESPRLSPSLRRESWSERLTAVVELAAPAEVDAGIAALFGAASKNG